MKQNKYKGWYFGYSGNGYQLVRLEKVNGKTIVKYAHSIENAKVVIDRIETRIKFGLEV